jgi:hypothetical protein
MAMYEAKTNGKNSVVRYRSDLDRARIDTSIDDPV